MDFRATTALCTVGILIAGASAFPAHAQDAGNTAATAQTSSDIETVTVTGSRISRSDYVSDTPLTTATADVIASAGSATLETSLNTLPQLSTSASSSASFVPSGGQANLDLRGMGSQRTLVLLNGRRLQPSMPNGTVDVNVIPTALVDSVEVITGGASAVYGSDAVAGVVNIKLKQHFSGVELNAGAGISDEGDGATRSLGVTAGSDFADGRGNGYISFDYSRRDGVASLDRPYLVGWGLSTNLPSTDITASASNLPQQSAVDAVFAKYGFAPGTVKSTSSLILSTNQDGTLFNRGGPVNYKGSTAPPLNLITAPGQFGASAGQVGVVVAAQDFWLAQIPLTRYNVFSHVDYKLNQDVSLYFEGLFTHYTAKTFMNPAVIGSSCCTQITVPVTNPFIPADLSTILASRRNPTANFNVTQAEFAFGPRYEEDQYNLYQMTVGAKGSLPFLDMTWDAFGSHSEVDYLATEGDYQSSSAINTLLSAPGGGTGICDSGLNIFGINPISSSCFQYIARTAHNTQKLGQTILELDTQGALFDLPAGKLQFAAGADYRENTYSFTPDALISTGDLSNYPAEQGSAGSANVKEVYGELLIPVLRDLPMAESVNADLGYRYSDYNRSGGVSTFKADLDWTVFDWLTARGGFARAVRAPSVGDLYLATTGSQVTIGNAGQFGSGDPCDVTGAYRNSANPNAAKVAALCAAQGVPAGFTNIQPRPPSTTQGNLALKPEKANTFSIGAVVQPATGNTFFSNLSLSVDYYHIAVSNTMGTIGGNSILDNCYTASTNPTFSANNYYCQFVSRSSTTGLISNISNPLLNLGKYTTSGVDAQMDWSTPLSALDLPPNYGTIGLSVLVNYLNEFDIQSTPDAPTLDFAGTLGNTQIDQYADAHPRWKGTATFTWTVDDIAASFRWRYLDAMKNYAFVGKGGSGPGAPAVSYFDLDAAWTISPDVQLRAGVTNLFDKAPPVLSWMPTGTDLYTYDIIGRRYFVALKYKL